MTGRPIDEEPNKHRRYRLYLQALEEAAEADETPLVTAVLLDEDPTMAEAASTRTWTAAQPDC